MVDGLVIVEMCVFFFMMLRVLVEMIDWFFDVEFKGVCS